MGYCVSMDLSGVCFPVSKVKEFWKIIRELEKDDSQKSGSVSFGGKTISRHYAWVSEGFSDQSKTVEEVFRDWRYYASRQGDHYVVEYFDGEKLGDDDVLWKALAPILDPLAQIECRGEDGFQWRWVFAGGKLKEQTARIVYDDEE